MTSTPLPLDGIRVVDFSELLPGPFVSQCLVDLGAQVVKVERPPHGDNARVLVPGVFEALNRGKRSVFLDLKNDEQRERALELTDTADIVLEGFRPGAMARLSLGFDTVHARNPKAIYVSLTGYGQDGPDATLPGHDLNYLAAAGVTAISGRAAEAPEHGYGLPVADLSGALYALVSVLAALQQREHTGRGQWLDVSITDCLLHMMNPRLGQFAVKAQHTLDAQREEVLLRPGYGVFAAADGEYVSIAAIEDHFWSRLVDALDLDTGGLDLRSYASRLRQTAQINRHLAERVAQLDASELETALRLADVPHARVVTPNRLPEHPQHRARGAFFTAGTSDGRELPLARFPVRMDGMPT